jgi:membrane protease YdiL (CAAX protease family)
VVYLAYYGALDAVSGIAAGTVVQATGETGTPQLDALFAIGTVLGRTGGYAFVAGVLVVIVSAFRGGARGPLYLVGSLGALASSVVFALSHIYWPRGGLAMVGLAVGFALLEFERARRATAPPAEATH